MQFQLVLQYQPMFQNPPILFRITRPQLCGKYLGTGFPQEWFQLFQTAALNQCQIGEQVARLKILDKYRGIGNGIEQRQ